MGHYANIANLSAFTIDVSGTTLSGYRGVVVNVIRAEQDFIDSGAVGDPAFWIQTSYNNSIRNEYAGIGYWYDTVTDAFYIAQPFPSWILVHDGSYKKWGWNSPVPYPTDGKFYIWNEPTLSWLSASP
jgi:hypothetical protein